MLQLNINKYIINILFSQKFCTVNNFFMMFVVLVFVKYFLKNEKKLKNLLLL